MQLGDLAHQIEDGLVAHLVAARELHRGHVRLASDDECVVFWAKCGDHHLGYADACLRRHKEREPFMLDLLQAPHRRAPRWVAIGEKAPASGEPLRILRVAAEESHPERTLGVAADILGIADALPSGRRQFGDLDAERRERRAHVPGRRHAGGRPEDELDASPRREAERQRAEDARWQPRAQHDRTDRGEWQGPRRRQADPAHELRPCDDENRRGCREPELGIAPVRQQMIVDRNPI